MKARSAATGQKAMVKGIALSDNVGGRVNSFAERRFGTEHFWPVTGDFPNEMDKCARILRNFTVTGIETQDKRSKRKVIRKIPSSVIASAKGLAIFTSMRSGIAPLGGAGGAGLVVARLPDGSWSAPASITPNNLSAGFLLGVDIYDCVLVIRSQEALDSFGGHKVTLGTEIAVVAGPWGAGAAVEAGKEKAPVFSYINSRGLYAGVEVVGQAFFSRTEENGMMYHWPGVKASDILGGKVPVPREAYNLVDALKDAESGAAQRRVVTASEDIEEQMAEGLSHLELEEGEVLKLPPTPSQTDGHEGESDPETERITHRSWQLALPKGIRHQARHSVDGGLPPPPPPPRRRVPPLASGASAGPSTPRATPPPIPPRSHARTRSLSPPSGPLGYTAPYETRKEHVPSPLVPAHAAFVHDALPLSPHGTASSASAASGSIHSPASDPPAYHSTPESEPREWVPAEEGEPELAIPPVVGTPSVLIPPAPSPGLRIPVPEMTKEEKDEFEQVELERRERDEALV
ncbi:hypothetical protein VHUM_03257 [Vanrija humicola]|uniref:Ysc84 actin-binding domain-containing protein n=1 Tax=Vanrija humicola TaxID=5417 RepID=A0A7D8Z3Q7_VANHU|nr:hypothetical protein VHUM_03257 [Vanrija humicola]